MRDGQWGISPRVFSCKYYFREMKAKQSGVSMTMTVTKIKFGVSDDVFKFDPKNYPNAIIVRK